MDLSTIAPLGGYILAMVMTAAILSQAEHQPSAQDRLTPAHITAHFLSRSSIGPINFHIQVLRSGKTWSTVEVKSVQKDRVNVIAQVLFKRTEVQQSRRDSPVEEQARIRPCVQLPVRMSFQISETSILSAVQKLKTSKCLMLTWRITTGCHCNPDILFCAH